MPNPHPDMRGLKRGGSPGRPRGVGNVASRAAKEYCLALVTDEQYRQQFQERLRKGELPPALEQMAWHFAYGRPPQSVEVVSHGLSLAELIVGVPLEPDQGEDADAH